jgi:hypothetical protein
MSSSSSESHAQHTIGNLRLRVGDQSFYAPLFEARQSSGILVDLLPNATPSLSNDEAVHNNRRISESERDLHIASMNIDALTPFERRKSMLIIFGF